METMERFVKCNQLIQINVIPEQSIERWQMQYNISITKHVQQQQDFDRKKKKLDRKKKYCSASPSNK